MKALPTEGVIVNEVSAVEVDAAKGSIKDGLGCGIIMLLIGLALLGFAATKTYETRAFLDRAVQVQGQVVRMDSHRSYDDDGRPAGTLYTAIVEYTDKAGARHEVRERISKGNPTRAIGDQVPVLYDPDDPAEARIDDYMGREGADLWLTLLGLFFAGFGVLYLTLLILGQRARRKLEAENAPHNEARDEAESDISP